MRTKYPHLVDGSIAASAPVFWFRNVPNFPEDIYDQIVTRTFRLSGCNTKAVLASFSAIKSLSQSEYGRSFLNEQFHLDESSKIILYSDGDKLIGAIQAAMETLAMVDYPYEANFLAPLPAWPVKVVCKHFNSKSQKSLEDYSLASYELLNLFYNSSGQLKTLCLFGNNCPGPFAAMGDPDGWPWQSCTEMVMPMCSSGPPRSFFTKSCPFSDLDAVDQCVSMFGKIGYNKQVFRPDWTITNFGAQYPTATNIVFSNGYLDPWSGGGWNLKPFTKGSLVSLIVEDGAHHFDLRAEHPNDTKSVKEVRNIEKAHIRRWINEANEEIKRAKKHYKHNMRTRHLH